MTEQKKTGALYFGANDGMDRTVGVRVESENVRITGPENEGLFLSVDGKSAFLSKNDAERVRDFLTARYEFEPRTLKDLDGDVWVEVEPEIFRLQGCTRTESLEAIEGAYGIDDEQTESPLAEWERELLALVEETKPAPRFQAGDRVVLTGPHFIADGLTDHTYREAPDGQGSTGQIVDSIDVYGEGKAQRVRWDGNGQTSVVATSSLDLVTEHALPEVGSTVRLVPVTRGFTAPEGSLATVDDVDPARWGGTPAISVRFHAETAQMDGFYAAADFQPFVAEPAGDTTGEVVFVTGDSDEWDHGYEPGTAVRVEGDDAAIDGSYLVKPLKGGRSEYVGANDLALESPRFQKIPTGAFVRVKSNGSNEGLRHYLEVGTVARVKGWTDTSTEEGSSYEETYQVEGSYEGGTLIDPLVQSVTPDTIAEIDPLEGFPRRYVLGMDPAVRDWTEAMKSAVFRFEDPAPRRLPVCGVPGCTLGCPRR